MRMRKLILPSDYLKRGYCNGPWSAEDVRGNSCYPDQNAARYSLDGSISAYLETEYDPDSDRYLDKSVLWLVATHNEIGRLFPEWYVQWHEENDPEECCFHPLDMVLSFGGDHGQDDCVRLMEMVVGIGWSPKLDSIGTD